MNQLLFLILLLFFHYVATAQDTSDYIIVRKEKLNNSEKHIDSLVAHRQKQKENGAKFLFSNIQISLTVF